MSYWRYADGFEIEGEAGNYFTRHWRGQLSLAQSYWVNGILLAGIASVIVDFAVKLIEQSGLSLKSLAAVYLTYLAFVALLWLWSMVGIWRSAGFHEERGGSAGWATAARIVVAIGVLGALGQTRNSALAAVEYAQLAAGQDPLGNPAQMIVEDDGAALLVKGNLTLGTAERFEDAVDGLNGVTRVLLQSAGGRSFEAERMAKLIAGRALDTEVKKECLSACTLVLLAGDERSATPSARVGFHQPTFSGWTAEDRQMATTELRLIYERAGVASDFLDRAMSVPPEQMWYPTHGELISGNVLNTTNIVVSKRALKARRAQLTRYLEYSADQINAAGPTKLDDLTTRIGATAAQEVLTLRFSLDVDGRELDLAEVSGGMREVLRNDACSDRPTRRAINAGASVVFSYQDRANFHLFNIAIEDCEEVSASASPVDT